VALLNSQQDAVRSCEAAVCGKLSCLTNFHHYSLSDRIPMYAGTDRSIAHTHTLSLALSLSLTHTRTHSLSVCPRSGHARDGGAGRNVEGAGGAAAGGERGLHQAGRRHDLPRAGEKTRIIIIIITTIITTIIIMVFGLSVRCVCCVVPIFFL
jgi:hypothetical protein